MKLRTTLRLASLLLAIMIGLAQPAAIMAAEGDEPPASSTPTATQEPVTDPPATEAPAPAPQPTAPTTGPTEPTGPQEPTGVIPEYAFNDATGRWVETNQPSFHWDAGLGRYTSPLYWYDPQVGWYHVIPPAPVVATPGAPAPAGVAAATDASQAAAASSGGGFDDPAAALAALLGLSDPSNSQTGPGSHNSGSSTSTSDLLLQLLGQSLIHNKDTSTATTGDASVTQNTTAGSATSGAASIMHSLFNLLNAVWSWSSGGLTTFIKNLLGDYTGDITLQPEAATGGGGQLGEPSGGLASNSNTGAGSTNNASSASDTDITVINRPNGSIVNDVDLLARSGDATVGSNTQAGSATSGDATVGLNIMNLINSAITAGQSFFGMLNILGSLNGDILFPDGFLDGLIGGGGATGGFGNATNTNTGANSTNTASTDQSNDLSIINQPNASITNNINSGAHSGSAAVTNNTVAGSATTGAANTNTNLFNLTDMNLFGDNAVLVLVNVMGRWVGRIVNMPDGGSSTGALLTGNAVAQNANTGANSINTATVSDDTDTTIINQPTSSITNNIRAGAISGDATVDSNTRAGDAQSGNANVATNVANIIGSQLNLKKWFGVLVINVFGDWTGSVGENTAAGSVTVALAAVAPAGVGAGELAAAIPTDSVERQSASLSTTSTGGEASSSSVSTVTTEMLADTPVVVAAAHTPELQAAQAATTKTGWLLLVGALVMLLSAGLFAAERRLGR